MSASGGLPMPILVLWLLLSPVPTPAQEEHHCREAHRFLIEEAGMTAVTEADTIDDWRSRAMVPGCRVTASGVTTRTAAAEARSFYEAVRATGWTRTPDPMDAPNEASLRFRKDGSDCLFNFYSGGLLGTEAEATVENAVVPEPGEQRYNFLVLCMAAREAAER